jgi:MFS family permease
MCFAPFAGRLVDRMGRRATLMMGGAFLMIPCYILLAFTMIPPRWPMILLGAAFVLVPAAMWPAVPLIVDEKRVGTAFGLMTTIQNLGLALFPWLNGKLRVVTHNYTASMLMFASLGAVGLVFAVLLKRADRRGGGVLERGQA